MHEHFLRQNTCIWTLVNKSLFLNLVPKRNFINWPAKIHLFFVKKHSTANQLLCEWKHFTRIENIFMDNPLQLDVITVSVKWRDLNTISKAVIPIAPISTHQNTILTLIKFNQLSSFFFCYMLLHVYQNIYFLWKEVNHKRFTQIYGDKSYKDKKRKPIKELLRESIAYNRKANPIIRQIIFCYIRNAIKIASLFRHEPIVNRLYTSTLSLLYGWISNKTHSIYTKNRKIIFVSKNFHNSSVCVCVCVVILVSFCIFG